jgi:hypothetical protein
MGDDLDRRTCLTTGHAVVLPLSPARAIRMSITLTNTAAVVAGPRRARRGGCRRMSVCRCVVAFLARVSAQSRSTKAPFPPGGVGRSSFACKELTLAPHESSPCWSTQSPLTRSSDPRMQCHTVGCHAHRLCERRGRVFGACQAARPCPGRATRPRSSRGGRRVGNCPRRIDIDPALIITIPINSDTISGDQPPTAPHTL